MARRFGPNSEVEEIVNRVLEGKSLGQAEIHLGMKLSKDAIRSLKQGKVGWESTVRLFAEGFVDAFGRHYGDAITARFGEFNARTVSDWFAERSGFDVPGAPADDTPEEADGSETSAHTAALAQQVAELNRKFEQLSQRIDPLAQLRAQFPRVRDYLWVRFGAVSDLCTALGLPTPEVPRFEGGSDSLTHDQADAEIEELLEELRQEHPEYAERLKLEE